MSEALLLRGCMMQIIVVALMLSVAAGTLYSLPLSSVASISRYGYDEVLVRSHDFRIIDSMAKNVPKGSSGTIELVVTHLNQHCKNDLEKVRAYYVWITDNIVYDVATYRAIIKKSKQVKPQDAESVFKERLGVCAGYSALFRRMCSMSKIENCRVSGFADPFSTSQYVKLVTDSIGHAWNAVRVDDSWGLIDATWGAGHTAGNDEWEKAFDANWFMAQPEMFAMNHMPYSSLQTHLPIVVNAKQVGKLGDINSTKLTSLDTLLLQLPDLSETVFAYADASLVVMRSKDSLVSAYKEEIEEKIAKEKAETEAEIKELMSTMKSQSASNLDKFEEFFDKVCQEAFENFVGIARYNDSLRMSEDSLRRAYRDKKGGWRHMTSNERGFHGPYRYTTRTPDSTFLRRHDFQICVNGTPVLNANIDSVERFNMSVRERAAQNFVSPSDLIDAPETFSGISTADMKASRIRANLEEYITKLRRNLRQYTEQMYDQLSESLGKIDYTDRKLVIQSRVNENSNNMEVVLMYRGNRIYTALLKDVRATFPKPQENRPLYMVRSPQLDSFYAMRNYDAFLYNHQYDVALYKGASEVLYREAEYILKYELGYDLEDIDDNQQELIMDAELCESQHFCFLTPALIGVDDLIPKHRKAYAILKNVVEIYTKLDPEDEPAEMEAAEKWLDIVEDWLDDNDPTWD